MQILIGHNIQEFRIRGLSNHILNELSACELQLRQRDPRNLNIQSDESSSSDEGDSVECAAESEEEEGEGEGEGDVLPCTQDTCVIPRGYGGENNDDTLGYRSAIDPAMKSLGIRHVNGRMVEMYLLRGEEKSELGRVLENKASDLIPQTYEGFD